MRKFTMDFDGTETYAGALRGRKLRKSASTGRHYRHNGKDAEFDVGNWEGGESGESAITYSCIFLPAIDWNRRFSGVDECDCCQPSKYLIRLELGPKQWKANHGSSASDRGHLRRLERKKGSTGRHGNGGNRVRGTGWTHGEYRYLPF